MLDAYLAAGVESDHESTTLAEAEEKRRKGMWVFLRQGSASQNLVELAPTIVAHGTDRAAFCTDDREPDTLRRLGHVNDCARLAVAAGISEIEAILLASTNPARYHGFSALGSLGPGHQADVLAFSSLRLVACPSACGRRDGWWWFDGVLVPGAVPAAPAPGAAASTRSTSAACPAPTRSCCRRGSGRTGPGGGRGEPQPHHSPSPSSRWSLTLDLAHAAVVERHRATGRVGRGFVTGFGLERGAIASTVAHDAHNLAVVGRSGEDMHTAVARLAEIGGGQVAVLDGPCWPRSRCRWPG